MLFSKKGKLITLQSRNTFSKPKVDTYTERSHKRAPAHFLNNDPHNEPEKREEEEEPPLFFENDKLCKDAIARAHSLPNHARICTEKNKRDMKNDAKGRDEKSLFRYASREGKSDPISPNYAPEKVRIMTK